MNRRTLSLAALLLLSILMREAAHHSAMPQAVLSHTFFQGNPS